MDECKVCKYLTRTRKRIIEDTSHDPGPPPPHGSAVHDSIGNLMAAKEEILKGIGGINELTETSATETLFERHKFATDFDTEEDIQKIYEDIPNNFDNFCKEVHRIMKEATPSPNGKSFTIFATICYEPNDEETKELTSRGYDPTQPGCLALNFLVNKGSARWAENCFSKMNNIISETIAKAKNAYNEKATKSKVPLVKGPNTIH